MSFELPFRIKLTNPFADIDERYGPYASLSSAYAAIPIELRKECCFGVRSGGIVQDYTWNSVSLGNGQEVRKYYHSSETLTKEEIFNATSSNLAGTIKSLDFNPGTPSSNVFYMHKAGPGTLIHFLDEDGEPLVIPEMDGGEYVIVPTVTFNGTYWTASWGRADLSGFTTKVEAESIKNLLSGNGDTVFDIPTSNTTAWDTTAGFGGVAFVADGQYLTEPIGSLSMYLQITAGTTKLGVTFYERNLSDADSIPGAAVSDVILNAHDEIPIEIELSTTTSLVEIFFGQLIPNASKSYVVALQAYNASDELQILGFGQGSVPVGLPNRIAGFYKPTISTGWTPINSGSGAASCSWNNVKFISTLSLRKSIDLINKKISKIDKSFADKVIITYSRNIDGGLWPASDGHYNWSFGVQSGTDISVGSQVENLSLTLQLGEGTEKIHLSILKRATSPSTYNNPPGYTGDILLSQVTRSADELGITGDGFTNINISIPSITIEESTTYLFSVTGLDNSDETSPIGISQKAVSGLTQQQRGFFDNSNLIPNGAAVPWGLGYVAYGLDGIDEQLDTRDKLKDINASVANYNVSIVGNFQRDNQLIPLNLTTTLIAPTHGDVVNESAVLSATYSTLPIVAYNSIGLLAHKNLSNVVVVDASTSAVLVLGVDYNMDANLGLICRATIGDNRNVNVSYHWSKRRYDLICINAENLAIEVIQGVERDKDAGEFLPNPTNSRQLPLFNARLVDGIGIEMIPLWYLDDGVHVDLLENRNIDYAKQRAALSKVIRKAIAGQTITIAAMTDSIVAQEGASHDSYTPNQQGRDRKEYFSQNIGSDRIAQLTLYDNGDGAGQVHVRTSTGWAVCKALEQLGATINYKNFGIGGTTSGSGANNAGDASLRSAVWATSPDLLIVHYGMNETGSNNTEANLRNLFDDAFSRGISVLAIGMPRPSVAKGVDISLVRKTWRATRRAAEYYNPTYKIRGSYFASERLVDDEFKGAMGLSLIDYGASDHYHHPGIHECEIYSNEIIRMLTE
jgi:hypothetical protein